MGQWKASGFSVKHLDRNWNCGMQMSQDRRITLWFHGSTTNKSPLLKSITCTLPARISVWPHESCREQKLIKSPKNRRAGRILKFKFEFLEIFVVHCPYSLSRELFQVSFNVLSGQSQLTLGFTENKWTLMEPVSPKTEDFSRTVWISTVL